MPRRAFAATLQFRTSLDQAGRIAGLAGELDESEAEILRRLVDWSLARPKLLQELRAELASEADDQAAFDKLPVEEQDEAIERARRRG